MRLYAATWLEAGQKQVLDTAGQRKRLLSFAHVSTIGRSKHAIPWEEYVMASPKPEIFLDSGAYTAFTKGTTINLQEYIDFIKANLSTFTVYANLDVIGNAEKTWENQLEMERQGLHPLPCFHYGEDFSWLKRYVEKYEYFAIGGFAGLRTLRARQAWLDDLFDKYLTFPKGHKRAGWPIRKYHGYAVTTVSLMRRYPWYSVDSTTWVLASRYGGARVWMEAEGEEFYLINFSDRSTDNDHLKGRHFTAYSGPEQNRIRRALQRTGAGYTPEQLSTEYTKRDEVNILFFLEFERRCPVRPFDHSKVAASFDFDA